MAEKTHYRKAFDSPYLSSADIVEPIVLTVDHVSLEPDRTKKTKDVFNTAHFVEKEIRPGETLKPMILNATNSKTMKGLTDSPYINDWNNIQVTVYVEHGVKFGRETMDGLRIRAGESKKKFLTPDNEKLWEGAKVAFKRDGNLKSVLERVSMTDEHQMLLMEQCKEVASDLS
jgi:hypothetical protein